MGQKRDQASQAAARSRPSAPELRGAVGGMGVSSERVGHAGPGQEGTDGLRPTALPADTVTNEAPEQHPWGEEENPVGLPPKAGYPRLDPRHEEHPYRPDKDQPESRSRAARK